LKFITRLTEQNKHDILELFYRTELWIGEKIVDNTDRFISGELGICEKVVAAFVGDTLKTKYRNWGEQK